MRMKYSASGTDSFDRGCKATSLSHSAKFFWTKPGKKLLWPLFCATTLYDLAGDGDKRCKKVVAILTGT